jgi:hypothetical protein
MCNYCVVVDLEIRVAFRFLRMFGFGLDLAGITPHLTIFVGLPVT